MSHILSLTLFAMNSSPSDKNDARQRYIAGVVKKDAEKRELTPIKSFTTSDEQEVDSTLFASFASNTQYTSQTQNVQSDKHLLASLSSARGSILSLEIANKDLLDALSSRHDELDKAKAEMSDLQGRFHAQSEQIVPLKRDIERLQFSVSDRDRLLAARDQEVKEARLEIEHLLTAKNHMQAQMLKLAVQINDIREDV
jgi:chromosome segregation ATPase